MGKFERKLARGLGELLALIELDRAPEGIHAYDLRKKVEEAVFGERETPLEIPYGQKDAGIPGDPRQVP